MATDHGTLTGLEDDDHPQYALDTDLSTHEGAADPHAGYVLESVVNAKGDLYVATADNTITRLAVGSNGQVLVADSAQAAGVKWAAPSASGVYWFTGDLTAVDYSTASTAPAFTTVTCDTTAHTKGGYSQIIASSSGTATMMRVIIANTSSTGVQTQSLVDIATGGAGNESVVIANIDAGSAPTWPAGVGFFPFEFWFPVSVAAGTRISARAQSVVAGGKTVDVHVSLFNGSNKTATAIDTLGTVLASSRGAAVTPGAGGAEGNWTEVIASTANAYTGLMWSVQNNAAAQQNSSWLLDIGTGAAGAESAIISDLYGASAASEAVSYPRVLPIYGVSISSSTRLSARMQQSSGGAASHAVSLFGLR